MKLTDGFERAYDDRWRYTKKGMDTFARVKAITKVIGNPFISDIRGPVISKLIKGMTAEGYANSSINRHLSALAIVLKMANEDWGIIGIGSIPNIPRLKEPVGRIRVITLEEEAKIVGYFRAIDDHDMADLVILLVDTGCRLSEILNLEQRDCPSFLSVAVWENKTSTPKTIPLTRRGEAIARRRSQGVGPKLFGGLSRHGAEYRWKTMRAALGFNDKEFVIHALRHTCASRLVSAGVELYTVSKFLGHKSVVTTQRYAHLAPERLAGAALVLDGLCHF